MLDADADAFDRVMQDLCLAFNRPYTPELTRVYWESLKHLRIDEVKRAGFSARNNLKKFPAPKDLIPEKRYAAPAPVEQEVSMSSWAVAANRILLAVAYFDVRRGFKPIGVYPPMPERGYGLPLRLVPPTDDSLQRRLMDVKREYVQMAEQAERDGETWDPQEFNAMCRQGFEKLLGTTGASA